MRKLLISILMLMFLAAPQFISTNAKASEDCPFFYGTESFTIYYADSSYSSPVGYCEANNCTGYLNCDGEITPYYNRYEHTVVCC